MYSKLEQGDDGGNHDDDDMILLFFIFRLVNSMPIFTQHHLGR